MAKLLCNTILMMLKVKLLRAVKPIFCLLTVYKKKVSMAGYTTPKKEDYAILSTWFLVLTTGDETCIKHIQLLKKYAYS